MDISFTNNDPTNTTAFDVQNGKALYEVVTNHKFMKKITTLTRALHYDPEAGSSSSTASTAYTNTPEVVAEIEWHRSRPSQLSMHQKRHMPLNMFLHNGSGSGIFGLSRTFVGPDEKRYTWKSRNDHLELIDKITKDIVAESHATGSGLDIQESGMHFMDHIVLTYLVMEKKRREQKTANSVKFTSTLGTRARSRSKSSDS